MEAVTSKPIDLVSKVFSTDKRVYIISVLVNELGGNLPGIDRDWNNLIERIWFAAIKVSCGKVEEFSKAVELVKIDWRDLLVWAEFADNADEHNIWAETVL